MSVNRFREWYRSFEGRGRPLILAHRGDSFRAPENTMAAAELGHDAGADGWELDVRLTADGQPVVIHDESLLRTTDVARRYAGDPRGVAGYLIGQFTLQEIRTLEAGSWFVESDDEPRSARGFGSLDRIDPSDRLRYQSGTIRVPTLIEALSWTMERGWLVNVEIKPNSADSGLLVDAVLDAIARTNAWNCVTVSSFDHDVVEKVARRESRVATGALILGSIDSTLLEWLATAGIDAIHGPPGCITASETSKITYPILVYTVNDAGQEGLATRLAEAGVAGLFTDDPVMMANRFGLSRS